MELLQHGSLMVAQVLFLLLQVALSNMLEVEGVVVITEQERL